MNRRALLSVAFVALLRSRSPEPSVAAALPRSPRRPAAAAPSSRAMPPSGGAGPRPDDAAPLVRWAIVGLGDVVAVKAGPAFHKCRGSTLAAVMRRTPGAARAWIEENAAALPAGAAASLRAFDGVEEMMEEMEGSLDAVYVASPPGAHLENVRQIVRGRTKGSALKAVYVEKPCGRCAWETRAIAEELRARGVAFYPAYVSRAHERTRVLRELLGAERVCGDRVTGIRYTQRGSSLARGLETSDAADNAGRSIPWRLVAEQSGGGLIMDMGCHVLDRLDYLFGPLEQVKSTVARRGLGAPSASSPSVENFVSMSATIGDCDWSAVPAAGASVDCVWDFSPPGSGGAGDEAADAEEVDELVISGPEGSLRMAAMGAGRPIEVLDAGGRTVRTLRFAPPAHAAQPLIQSIVDELRGPTDGGAEGEEARRAPARSPARADNAIRTAEVLDAVLGSYYRGRHDEFWARPDTWSSAAT